MSTPTVERTRPAGPARTAGQPGAGGPVRTAQRAGGSGPAQSSAARPARRSGGTEGTRGRGAIGRAYARRAVRERRLAGEEYAAGRSQFVLLIMVLLGSGLVTSLWLSTTAAADSYRLDAARQATRDLTERSEALRTEIASMQSAPALAEAAQRMGMVQVSDPARLVVAPDGSVELVGVPKAAVAPPPPAPPAPAAPMPAQPGEPGQQPAQPGEAAQPGQLAQSGQAGQSSEPGQQPAQPGEAAQPGQLAQSGQAGQSSQDGQSGQAGQSGQDGQSGQPGQSSQAGQPALPGGTAQPSAGQPTGSGGEPAGTTAAPVEARAMADRVAAGQQGQTAVPRSATGTGP